MSIDENGFMPDTEVTHGRFKAFRVAKTGETLHFPSCDPDHDPNVLGQTDPDMDSRIKRTIIDQRIPGTWINADGTEESVGVSNATVEVSRAYMEAELRGMTMTFLRLLADKCRIKHDGLDQSALVTELIAAKASPALLANKE